MVQNARACSDRTAAPDECLAGGVHQDVDPVRHVGGVVGGIGLSAVDDLAVGEHLETAWLPLEAYGRFRGVGVDRETPLHLRLPYRLTEVGRVVSSLLAPRARTPPQARRLNPRQEDARASRGRLNS